MTSGQPTLRTARLLLRPRREAEAAVYRQLWTERDPRVPAHRRIDARGRPGVADIAASIRAERRVSGLGLLAVELQDGSAVGGSGVIGYCGLLAGDGACPGASPEVPQLAYELVRSAHGHGYATEAAGAVVAWADGAGYRSLSAWVWEWNVASLRVLAKLRFREARRCASPPGPPGGDNILMTRARRR